jgi:son of sevenless
MAESSEESLGSSIVEELQLRRELIERLGNLEQRNVQLRNAIKSRRLELSRGQSSHALVSGNDGAPVLGSSPSIAAAVCSTGTDSKQNYPSQATDSSKVIGQVLEACSFLSTSNVNLRASLASLLQQQEIVVLQLAKLSEGDKRTIMDLIEQRYAEAENDAGRSDMDTLHSLHGAFSLGGAGHSSSSSGGNVGAVVARRCPVDSGKLESEWDRIFLPEQLRAAISPTLQSAHTSVLDSAPVISISPPESSESSPEEEHHLSLSLSRDDLEFIVDVLHTNRRLYMDAISNANSAEAEADAITSFGFSMLQMPGYEYEFDEEDTEHNIVTSVDSSDDSEQIKCATLNKLIERMTMENKQDLNVRYTFLLTYRSFTTPAEFLMKLKQRYYVPVPPNASPSEIEYFKRVKLAPVQIKVFGVLKKWLEEHYSDFKEDSELRKRLADMIDEMIERSLGPWAAKSARSLKKLMERMQAGMGISMQSTDDYPKPLVPVDLPANHFSLIQCKPLEIARQLCLINFQTFKNITPREFLNQAWTKKNKHELAPNIMSMIDQFNRLTCWVQNEILSQNDLETRVDMLVKFLKVAKHCRKLNNYHSLRAIMAGLGATNVHRLRKTWAATPNKQVDRHHEFKDLCSLSNNSKRLRDALKQAINPCIPHIGLLLTDLIHLDELPDSLNGMINFYKRRKLAEGIMWIKQYQQHAYRFQPVPVLQDYFAENMVILKSDDLWQKSATVEPRMPRAT